MDLRRFSLELCAAATLAGCADQQRAAEIGIPFNASLVEYIQINFTSQREVINWFGNPLARSRLADREGQETDQVRYGYLHGGAKGTGSAVEYLEVELDPDGLVTEIYFTEGDDGPPDI